VHLRRGLAILGGDDVDLVALRHAVILETGWAGATIAATRAVELGFGVNEELAVLATCNRQCKGVAFQINTLDDAGDGVLGNLVLFVLVLAAAMPKAQSEMTRSELPRMRNMVSPPRC
jgi:hypothetical protein